ncbi:MAG: hypothetical protein HQ503_02855 [Rhodospirillales bacterium]|nr:hypothetical protein [Rhodospirillales bacterium]
MRIFLTVVLPLVAPFVIYLVWVTVDARRKGRGLPNWEEGNWFWAFIAGGVLMVLSLGYLVTRGEEPGTKYMPPHYDDGKILPGKYK